MSPEKSLKDAQYYTMSNESEKDTKKNPLGWTSGIKGIKLF